MLKSIYIDNFKSLVDFRLDLSDPLTGLIGLNGAGKTTLLQALDFLRALVTGRVSEWMKARGWKAADMICQCAREIYVGDVDEMRFCLDFNFEEMGCIRWEATYKHSAKKCNKELFYLNQTEDLHMPSPHRVFLIGEMQPNGAMSGTHPRYLKYEGSIVSIFDGPDTVQKIRDYMLNLQSLELFSLQMMRQSSEVPEAGENMGRSGEKLSGFVAKLTENQRASLLRDLKIFYPGVNSLTTREVTPNYFELLVDDQHTTTGARHLNDGMLRILAILAQMQTSQSCVLLEEIENGMNPEMIARLVKYLLDAPKQVIFTTHSPLILNYMPDDRAKESIFLIYKNPQGITRATRFCEIPKIAKKLSYMGPGEAMIDTDMEDLVNQLNKPAPTSEDANEATR